MAIILPAPAVNRSTGRNGNMETIKIWHTATEIPNGKDSYIFKWKDHKSYKLVRDKIWIESRLQSPTCFDHHIERWAYIKDLESICEQLQHDPIDWEQRRYEIAKEVLSDLKNNFGTLDLSSLLHNHAF